MRICRFLINFNWWFWNYTWWHPVRLFVYKRLFQPCSAKYKDQISFPRFSLLVFICFAVFGTLMPILQLVIFKHITVDGWTYFIAFFVFSLPSFIHFIFSLNKNYKLYLKALKYLDTLDDSKLIACEINKMYYETKMINETQWKLYKFWYLYQKDIPWNKKDCVIVGTRKDFKDKILYQSDIAELVKDL
ncbi:MAG: hypothetical protein Ta2E_04000 [Mycoplasmoidaceae bacterium]|nr:MAG: hypothetical protein Ta2E_04000 [Mycoplasmoidaceae bacterium]